MAFFLGSIPYAGRVVASIPAFLVFSQALIVGALFVTAAMLLAEVRLRRQVGFAVLAVMYLFAGLLAAASLVYVRRFLPQLDLPQYLTVPPWFYVVRHGIIPLFVIAYALVMRTWTGGTIPTWRGLRIWAIVAGSFVAGAATLLLVVGGSHHLPSLSSGHILDVKAKVYAVEAVLYALALTMLATQRYRTRLMLWVGLATWAFFLDLTGFTITAHRSTLEFFVSRLLEIFGSMAVLGFVIYFGLESYRSASAQADQIEAKRDQERHRFAATVNSAALGIAHVDATGSILFMNERLARIIGAQSGGRTLWELLGIEPKALPLGAAAPISFEISGQRPDGTPYHAATTISAPRSGGLSPSYWIAFVHDVTARRQAEASVLQMNEIKSSFISTVTHEIRTPLSGIVGVSELLNRTPMSEKQRRFAEALDSSANSLLRLINDVLDFSKIETAGVEFDRTLFDLGHLVETVAEAFAGEAARRGLALAARISPDLAGGFYGDPVRLRQILDNLVGNAIKFTETGSVSILAERSTEHGTRTTVAFSVIDTGIGIPAAAQEQIFEAFTQAEGSTTRRFGGTGLGLAIVRRLIDQMGGRIEVTSVEGQGSTFRCTIPLDRDLGGLRLDQSATSLRGQRCAIVSSDDELLSETHALMLSWGMHVLSSSSADELAEHLRRAADGGAPVQCAIVDSDLRPAASLVRRLCNEQQLEDLKFIFLGSMPEEAAALISPWRRRLIRKPVSASSLYDALTQLCLAHLEERPVDFEAADLAPLHPERILIAEDNETNRLVALAQLEELGFGADFVEDGAGAITAVKTGLYALVLMDCQMPGVDGFAATAQIREFEKTSGGRLPIIAMTANTSSGYRERCLEAGMDDYLAKPVLLSSLSTVLTRWVPRGTMRPENARSKRSEPVNGRFERLHTIFKGDRSAIARVLDSALRTFDDGLEALLRAEADHDHTAAARSAHRMAGVAADVDAADIAALCRNLESVWSESAQWREMPAELEQLDALVEEFRLDVVRAADGR